MVINCQMNGELKLFQDLVLSKKSMEETCDPCQKVLDIYVLILYTKSISIMGYLNPRMSSKHGYF